MPAGKDLLYGPSEVTEDFRQAGIQSQYPSLFWTYLVNFDIQCYPGWQNHTFLATAGTRLPEIPGLIRKKITTCAPGDEGMSLVRDDENKSRRDTACGSPTLIINGITCRGARIPDAYNPAICHRYDGMPFAGNGTLPAPAAAGTSTCLWMKVLTSAT